MDYSYYEFPSFKVAVFSLLLAFVLSSVIALTYKFTHRGISYSGNFFQAMILASSATSMVIMAVGNNVAVGFGIIGAIAIIRFRTRINEPRNIIFIFASLGVGIATGVYGYSIAIAGTAVFCLVSGLLFISNYGFTRITAEFNLLFSLLNETDPVIITNFLKETCQDFRLIRVNNTKRGDRYEYFITLKKTIDKDIFYERLKNMEGVSNVRLERGDNLSRI